MTEGIRTDENELKEASKSGRKLRQAGSCGKEEIRKRKSQRRDQRR